MPKEYQYDDNTRFLYTSIKCTYCGDSGLNWIQAVKPFEHPHIVVLTARCVECGQLADIVIALGTDRNA